MVSYATGIVSFLCACLCLANAGIMALEPSALDSESQRHAHSASQHESPRTDVELRAPAALESFLQGDDLARRDAAAELRIPDSLRTFLLQSDITPLRPCAIDSRCPANNPAPK